MVLPPDAFDVTDQERRTVVRWLGWVLAFFLAAGIVLALSGCAAAPAKAPECEDFQIGVMPTPGGPLFVFDRDGMRALGDLFRKLQHGECRLPAYDRPEA